MRLRAALTLLLLAHPFINAGEEELDINTIIVLKFDEKELTVRLNASQASRDFVAMLPMTLTFRDYNNTEKISDLPRTLSTDGSPAGFAPSAGDFTYYAPWGNLAIFYRGFTYSNGLIPLGTIESDVRDLLSMQGECTVEITVKR